jgi:hypothetical protein
MTWGVRLEGHDFDLLDWMDTFQRPLDPWVEKVQQPGWTEPFYVLRTAEFDAASSPNEVSERAGPLVDRLQGAMTLSRGGEPVKQTTVIEFRPDGSIGRHYAVSVGTAVVRTRASAAGVVLGKGGVTSPSPVQQPDALRWNELVDGVDPERSDLIADLLVHVGRCDNWFDIYKTIELAEKLADGEHSLQKLLRADSGTLKNARTTANFYRHARAIKPTNLASLAEARRLAHMAAKFVLNIELSLAAR